MLPSTAEIDGESRPGRLFLQLDTFEGPLDLLLGLARARQVDLARVSLPMLVDQLLASLGGAIVPERKAEWVSIAAWLVLLRSRLLLPTDTQERRAGHAKAGELHDRLRELQLVQAGAAWLDARPQLGREVFARGRPELLGLSEASDWDVDVVEFLWAAMAQFEPAPGIEPLATYAPPRPDLHSVEEGRARILGRLRTAEKALSLADVLPEAEAECRQDDRVLRHRSRWTSTLVAALELVKQQLILVEQPAADDEMPAFQIAKEDVS